MLLADALGFLGSVNGFVGYVLLGWGVWYCVGLYLCSLGLVYWRCNLGNSR